MGKVRGGRLIGALAAAMVVATSCEEARPTTSSDGVNATPAGPSSATAADGGTTTGELDASGDASAEVTSLLAQLVRTVDANASAYDEVDLADLNDALTVALVRAESPGGRGATSAACASQAIANGFDAMQAATLCADDWFDAAACAAKAHGVYGFDRDLAVSLCAGRGSTETADCAQAVFGTLGMSRAQAVAVCTDRGGAVVPACVTSALGAGFDRDTIVTLCAHRGSASTATCASRALGLGFTRDQAIALCATRGAPETATCASTASSTFGFTRDQGVAICANRGQPSNASCASRVLANGLTRDEAIVACRRPPSTTTAPE